MIIPKIIHIIWIGNNPFPEEYKKYKESWLKYNPDWELMFWTNDNLPEIVNKKEYDELEVNASKADILRLEVLYQYGGVYSDADSECLKSLESLIGNYTCFGCTGIAGKVKNATLGCTKNHPAFKELVYGFSKYYKEVKQRDKYNIHDLTGAHYITPVLWRYSDFVQIDKGRKMKQRKIICSTKDENTPEMIEKYTYILHYDKLSWIAESNIIGIKKD
jgi:mannosyltransferase OCH1-like enzyme